jgi:hypothetical protein
MTNKSMKTLYTEVNAIGLSLMTLATFLFSALFEGVNLGWLSLLFSLAAMFVCYKTNRGKSLVTCMLFIIHLIYTGMWCFVGLFLWCLVHSEPFL